MTKKLLLLVGLALLASCSKEHTSPEKPETELTMGAPAALELEGGLELGFGYADQVPVDEMDSGVGEVARALDIYQKPDESFSFDINIAKYKDVKMQLFLRRVGAASVTSIHAPVTITKLSNGKYHIRVVMEKIRPVDAADFATGEWFITGFWGGGAQSAVSNNTKHEVANVAPTSPDNVGDKVEMDIPLGFPWTKIKAVKKGSTVLLKHDDLKIQPMGILFCLTPNNRTKNLIDLVKLDKELQGFAIGGYFDVAAKAPVEGEFPKFDRGFLENINNEGVPVRPYDVKIASGQKASKPIYLWAIPTEETATDYMMSFSFMSDERTSMDDIYADVDRFNLNGVAKFTDRYTIDYNFPTRPKHGQYFLKEMKIRTSPMITEYFMNRVRNGATKKIWVWNGSQWVLGTDKAFNDPYFYGYVEIYNPNIDDIAIENYALCRIANVRRATLDNAGNVINYGPNFPYFHPHGAAKFRDGGRTGDNGTADRNADADTESHKALLLSLQLKNGQKSSFSPFNSLGFKSQFETVSRKIEEAQVSVPQNDNRIEKVKFFKGGLIGGRAILKGGKTMLVLGNGYLEQNTRPAYVYTPDGVSANIQRHHSSNKLDYIADTRVDPLPRKVVEGLENDDECQMIVAVDNYLDKSTNPGGGGMAAGIDYYAILEGAGVMNLGWHDALFIVQKHKNNSKRRRIVDATSANPFARVNNWTFFAENVTLATSNDTGWPHFRVRTVAQHLPEFLNFTQRQWYPVKYTGKGSRIPSKTSPGRRSAVGLDRYYE